MPKIKTFQQYQKAANKTSLDEVSLPQLAYHALGISGEAGEVAEKIKKLFRDSGGELDEEKRELLKYELGDVLWYVSQTCRDLGFTIEDAATANVKKLSSRKQRNKIHGSGDKR